MMGLKAGTRIKQESLGFDKGLVLRADPKGDAKIYQRSYKSRKNNPFESQVDVQSQTLINDTFPGYINRFHFSIEKGLVTIKGLANEVFSIRRRLKAADNKFLSWAAMSSGLDMYSMEQAGFDIDGLLEYRPQERRDKTDLTETGALNALMNSSPKFILNEDITKVDWKRVERLTNSGEQVSFLHLCLQCDDFSNAKASSLKESSVEDLSTSLDLVYDGLRMVETIKPAVLLIENVIGFGRSQMGDLLKTKLRRWGYFVEWKEMDAREHGGLTSRKRFYLVASVYPGFEFPKKEVYSRNVWNELESLLTECRDVSHSKALKDGLTTGRARIISKDKAFAPTVLKSQNRQAKDSLYIEHEGRYLFPSEEVLRRLCGLPEGINLNAVSKTIASEIIGQGIDYPMHHSVCEEVSKHIKKNTDSGALTFKNSETL
jgi:DNA (cytosine-5)-methyltransferase 1